MSSNSPFEPAYRLRCSGCGSYVDDDGYRRRCKFPHKPALLRTVYRSAQLELGPDANLNRYAQWLPLRRPVAAPGRAGVYRSQRLAAKLGVAELWVALAGWAPTSNATLPTATFTDLQAAAAFARIAPDDTRPLVVAATGDSAASFAYVATVTAAPLVLVLNAGGLRRFANAGRIGDSVKSIFIAGANAEDVGQFAEAFDEEQYILEGGVANVARRDAAGTLLLEAVESIGRLPDVYVQATNNGIGALGVYEAAARLLADGRWGENLPQLVLGQSALIAPVHEAWSNLQSHVTMIPEEELMRRTRTMHAASLTSQTPAYEIRGGLFEALVATGGTTAAVTNEELISAFRLFQNLEEVEITPEAAVGVAALIQALYKRSIDPKKTVLLGITGAGRSLLQRDSFRKPVRPTIAVKRGTPARAVIEQLAAGQRTGAASPSS